MHKQFFRLFISIVLIMIFVQLFQLVSISIFGKSLVYVWSNQVFDEFAENVDKSLEDVDLSKSSSIYDFVFSNVSERISGFILRSSNEGYMLTFGQSGKGKIIPQLASFVDNNFTYMDSSISTKKGNSNVYEISVPKYRLDITINDPFGLVIADASFGETGRKGKTSVTYPSSIQKSDIAGTIEIYINGMLSAYLDVLVYSVDYYNPTSFILAQVYRSMAYTVPVALVLALLAAYVVSKKTERKVKDVEDSLSKLSRGQFDVALPETKIEEYRMIGDSIEALGKDLRRHSASRKEWIRNISHDLNTPVTSINMILEGIQDGMFPLNDETIAALKKENDTLMARIASVSYYSYLLSPDAKCEKYEHNLQGEIIEALSSFKENVKLSFDPQLIIYADEVLINRAFKEIIKNAIEYRIGTSDPVFTATTDSEYLIITLSNEGKLPDPLPLFFEPWARGDSSRTQGGSGLGLSIVYQIMELHKGKVAIREENGIVEVSLSFPLLDYVTIG